MSNSPLKSCPLCGSSRLDPIYEATSVPIQCNRLWPEREEAVNCPRGNIRLVFCRDCGLVTNTDFDPSLFDYSQEYENSLHYSTRFQSYARSLAERLIRRYDLRNREVMEIGCGKGDFLLLLCEMGGNRGVGFDPSYVDRDDFDIDAIEVKFIKKDYSSKYSGYGAELICCRQVLEHIPDPLRFLNNVGRAARRHSNTRLLFEVPNAMYTFSNLFLWDIIYEHCSYFTPQSLARLFTSSGLEVSEIAEEFDGQYLAVHATPGNSGGGGIIPEDARSDQVSAALDSFKSGYRGLLDRWRSQLDYMLEQGKRVVIWGAGSKGVSFLNLLKPGEGIEYAVDINPKKHGRYVAGSGQKIVSPESLKKHPPEVVIIMNPIYREEIEGRAAEIGITPQFVCL
jgi:SAM-dependent methyltransferase